MLIRLPVHRTLLSCFGQVKTQLSESLINAVTGIIAAIKQTYSMCKVQVLYCNEVGFLLYDHFCHGNPLLRGHCMG